ncbi:MAG: hypothetical protein E4H44_04355 [Candidatus Aminicenantes bacterium]|nr:MAG: hypothetical protein E4H44_04355 [Candidatus Aminicenantes bacterium]
MSKPALFRSILVCILAVAASGFGSDLDDRLNQRLKGAWAILEVEVYSACAGTYSDNRVGDAGVAGKAQYRFEAGELVKIDKVNAKRQRVDLLLTLDVPFRTSRVEGPFELFDERQCQVQLIVPVLREEIKAGIDETIVSRFEELITLYPTLDDARDSDSWNGRETEPLPSDYDQTLARYAVWQAEQTNAAVNDAVRRAVNEAADVAEDLSDDSDYLAGFAAGAEKMSTFGTSDCASLLSASLSMHDTKAPEDKETRWRDGWHGGQELIFNVLLAERLQACRVPVPPAP